MKSIWIRLILLPITLLAAAVCMMIGLFIMIVVLPFSVLFGDVTVNGKPLK